MSSELYDPAFMAEMRRQALIGAAAVVPIIVELTKCKSVIDIGCGQGTWLSTFQKAGVDDVFGIDGDYVDRALLEIDPSHFMAHDLANPLRLSRTFDVAVCLEVAEHLPASSANNLIDSLVELAPFIIFSAAIPQQGGTGHVNEQWPEYWAGRFQRRSYIPVDCIRPRIWNRQDLPVHYVQNVLLFGRESQVRASALLTEELAKSAGRGLSVVHPRLYLYKCEELDIAKGLHGISFRMWLSEIPKLARRAVRRLTRSRFQHGMPT